MQKGFPARTLVVLAVVLGLAGWAPAQDAPEAPTRRPLEQILQEHAEIQPEMMEVFKSLEDLADPARRAELAPRAIPLLKRTIQLKEEEAMVAARRVELWSQGLAFRALFGDQEAAAQLQQMLAEADEADAVEIRSAMLHARWVETGKDAAAQARVASEAEALVKAHPADDATGKLVMFLFHAPAATPELRERVEAMADHVEGRMGEWLRRQLPKHWDDGDAAAMAVVPEGPLEQIVREMREVQMKLIELIDTSAWTDSAKRTEAAPRAIPLLRRLTELAEEEAAHWPPDMAKAKRAHNISRFLAIRLLFDDPDAEPQLQRMLAEADERDLAIIRSQMLEMRWVAAAEDAEAQARVAEEVEALVRARPADETSTSMVEQLVHVPAATPELKQRMWALVEQLEGPRAERFRERLDQRGKTAEEP